MQVGDRIQHFSVQCIQNGQIRHLKADQLRGHDSFLIFFFNMDLGKPAAEEIKYVT